MTDNNIYEIGMLINPNLAQQGAEKTVETVKNILNKISASVISEGEVVDIDLAYQIITKIASKNEKFDQAFFAWVKFEVSPSEISVINEEIDKIKKEVFRYLIIKTVKDDEETDKYLMDNEEDGEEEEKTENKDSKKEEKDLTDKEINEEKSEKPKEKEEKKVSDNKVDDLTKIEGIGPKTVEALNKANIKTYTDLADSKVGDLRDILEENSLSRYEPKTWSKQARLARDEKWDELKELQDELDGGEVK
ncbi:MAG: 30S ribosomal protein S6 [Candidatus Pacebacteria bacterium]|nr:30S ribosomal protein S6 [Candidatus Paceibacterota bacterium]